MSKSTQYWIVFAATWSASHSCSASSCSPQLSLRTLTLTLPLGFSLIAGRFRTEQRIINPPFSNNSIAYIQSSVLKEQQSGSGAPANWDHIPALANSDEFRKSSPGGDMSILHHMRRGIFYSAILSIGLGNAPLLDGDQPRQIKITIGYSSCSPSLGWIVW